MNNFSLFSYAWDLFKNNPSLRTSEPNLEFIKGIEESFSQSKLFECEEAVKTLLFLTKPTKTKPKLPFENIFLDVSIKTEQNNELIGLLVREGELFKGTGQDKIQVGKGLRITTFLKSEEEGVFITLNPNGNDNLELTIEGEKIKNKATRKLQKNITDFVYNFVNFINSPEVKIIEVQRNEKNQKRRIREGKSILPSSKKIILTGYLKEYVNELVTSGQIRYSHKFWVRGHFRHYQKYHQKVIWILPYIKGKGVLIEKKYKLERGKE